MSLPSGDQQRERWQAIKSWFDGAIAVEAGEPRALFIRQCADLEVRAEVESLLDAHERPSAVDRLGALVHALRDAGAAHDPTGMMVGAYRIESVLGHGGMGSVFLASRADDQYRMQVAVKVIRPGLSGRELEARFSHERQTLASLDHPGIARLLDAGTTAERPYFVMEYVDGLRIDHYCEQQALPVRARLVLFQRVCAAVQHAHQRLVIHRDLKPDNILVAADGQPKLLDFGIAKVLQPDGAAAYTSLTAAAAPMTPRYASPEQIRGEVVTTATDVYALGVLLYELLSGRYPYSAHVDSVRALETAICGEQPLPPSRLSVVASNGARRRAIAGDLDTIVARAMHKDPSRRYASVEQLAADVQRHLDGFPVTARKDTLGYRAAKFVRRHRLGVSAAAVVMIAVAGGTAAAWWQARVADAERDRAQLEAQKAERVSGFMHDILGFVNTSSFALDTFHGKDLKLVDLLEAAARRLESDLADAPEIRGVLQRTIGTTFGQLAMYDLGEHHLVLALGVHRQMPGHERVELAKSAMALGDLYRAKGDYARARPLLDEALEIQRARPPDLDLVLTLKSLGALAWAANDLQGSERFAAEAVETARRTVGVTHPALALAVNDLGSVRNDLGDGAGAERHFREAVALFQQLPTRLLGEAIALGNLAGMRVMAGDYAGAERYLQQAAEQIRVLVGEENPTFPNALDNLAEVALRRGDVTIARERIERARAIQRRVFADGHPDTLPTVGRHAEVLMRAGDLTGAERELRQALAAGARFPAARRLAGIKARLGECLVAQGRYAEAERLLVESRDEFVRLFGPTHASSIKGMERLETLRAQRGAQ